MIIPYPRCARKEKTTGTPKNSYKNSEVTPSRETCSELLAQAAGKSHHQLDMETHVELRDIGTYYWVKRGESTPGNTLGARSL